jgi:uncharacterized membrane protein
MNEKNQSKSDARHQKGHENLLFGEILEGRRAFSAGTSNFIMGQTVLIMLWIILILIGFMFL